MIIALENLFPPRRFRNSLRDETIPPADILRSSTISQIGVVGINFKTAPIAVREYLAKNITLERIAKSQDLADYESVLLSTCNRLEIYYRERSGQLAKSIIELFQQVTLKEQFGFYHYEGTSAITHLFDVAVGLDSLVIGEAQILSQVREAARSSGKLCGPVLSKMFSRAFECGKKLREEDPEFSNGMKNSISLHVLDLITKRFEPLKKKPNLLLIGSGKMVRLAVASIDRSKLGTVDIAARRHLLNGLEADSIVLLSSIGEVIHSHKIDVVITATTAEEYILRPEHLGDLIHDLLILDISVPRNVDPRVSKLPRITLLNLDDFKETALDFQNTSSFSKLRNSISLHVNDYANWLKEYDEITPLLSALRKKVEAIREEEVQNALSRIPNLTLEQQLVMEKMTERIVKRFLHEPTEKLKQLAREHDGEKARQYAEILQELFSTFELEDEESPALITKKS